VVENRFEPVLARGLLVDGSHHNQIARNRIVRQEPGRPAPPGFVMDDSRANWVVQNVAVSNPVGFQVNAGAFNLFLHNVAIASSEDGFSLDAAAANTALIANQSHGNGDDGIDVEGRGTALIANSANRNGDLGIEAVPGTFAFGNRAAGNGNPLQCLNVRCR
jgi:hypothetical protein